MCAAATSFGRRTSIEIRCSGFGRTGWDACRSRPCRCCFAGGWGCGVCSGGDFFVGRACCAVRSGDVCCGD